MMQPAKPTSHQLRAHYPNQSIVIVSNLSPADCDHARDLVRAALAEANRCGTNRRAGWATVITEVVHRPRRTAPAAEFEVWRVPDAGEVDWNVIAFNLATLILHEIPTARGYVGASETLPIRSLVDRLAQLDALDSIRIADDSGRDYVPDAQ